MQNDIQRSTKHTHKTKDQVTRTPLKTGGELRCSGRVSNTCLIQILYLSTFESDIMKQIL